MPDPRTFLPVKLGHHFFSPRLRGQILGVRFLAGPQPAARNSRKSEDRKGDQVSSFLGTTSNTREASVIGIQKMWNVCIAGAVPSLGALSWTRKPWTPSPATAVFPGRSPGLLPPQPSSTEGTSPLLPQLCPRHARLWWKPRKVLLHDQAAPRRVGVTAPDPEASSAVCPQASCWPSLSLSASFPSAMVTRSEGGGPCPGLSTQ